MNTFYFSYIGNKRLEYNTIKEYIPRPSSINYFVEPFAGSASVAYLFYKDNKRANIEYIINDLDGNLIKFYEAVQNNKLKSMIAFINRNLSSSAFERIKKKKTKNLNEWYYMKKIYARYEGINPFKNRTPKRKVNNIQYDKYHEREEFDKQLVLTSLDFTEILDVFKNNKKAFLFIDPPYLDSFNSKYSEYQNGLTEDGTIVDRTMIFIQLKQFLDVAKCKVMIVINSNAIINYIFKCYITHEYSKTYGSTKKKTRHVIITNY